MPEVALSVTPAELAVSWMSAVDAISVPPELVIEPAVDVMLTDDPPVLRALAPKTTLKPPVSVIVPLVLLTVEEIVRLLLAPTEEIFMVPAPPAVTALEIVVDPKEAANTIFPEVLVLTPLLTVRLPVAAVKLKFMALNAALTSVDVVLFVIVYVVNPSPAPKLMAWVVFTRAVTVKPLNVAEPPCKRLT